jgi:hypothetical protein
MTATIRLVLVLAFLATVACFPLGKLHKKRIKDSAADPSFKLRGKQPKSSAKGIEASYSADQTALTKTVYKGVLPSLQVQYLIVDVALCKWYIKDTAGDC